MTLMTTVSGVRGIFGESLFPETVFKYVTAFGNYVSEVETGKNIIVGRDSRISGPALIPIAIGVLQGQGFNVIDCGIVPTPTVQMLVKLHNAAGGLIITSSHNPREWNGLKFVSSDSMFLSPEGCKKVYAMVDSNTFRMPEKITAGSVTSIETANDQHIDAIFALKVIDVESIRAKRFKVALDTIQGAGGPMMTKILERLGCDVVTINATPSGEFAHTPEPIPANLGDLCDLVKAVKADIGIAVDPDVDRCVLIDQNGDHLGEEYTLAIAVDMYLRRTQAKGFVVKNLSSSKASDEVAARYGCTCVAAPVGEINVANEMVRLNAVIGGEGNGGVMLPDLHIGRDAPLAAAMVLQALADSGTSISDLKSKLPQWSIYKLKAPLKGIKPETAIAKIKAKWESQVLSLNEKDGLRLDTVDWSNTEPIIRVIAEARDEATSKAIATQFMEEIVKC